MKLINSGNFMFDHDTTLAQTNLRDWAFLFCAKENVGYPQHFSRESLKHRPLKQDAWRVENESQAISRANRLIKLGVLKSFGNEVGLTKEGKHFVEYLIKDDKFKPIDNSKSESDKMNNEIPPKSENRVPILVALIGMVGVLGAALMANWCDIFPNNCNQTQKDAIEKYQGDWTITGSFSAGTYKGVTYEEGEYKGEVSRIEVIGQSFDWYNTQEAFPTRHRYEWKGGSYWNEEHGERIEFTSDSTAVQIMCCDRGRLLLKKL